MKLKKLLLAGVCAALTTFTCRAQAQTAPVRPAAGKPVPSKQAPTKAAAGAADGKTLSMGGAGSGAILTREELRACLNQDEALRVKIAASDANRPALDREKEAVTAEQEALRNERLVVEEMSKKAQALAARWNDYAARVESWNKRQAELTASGRTGLTSERQRAELDREREEMAKEQVTLDADKERLAVEHTPAAAAYNVKFLAASARVTDWNKRNEAWNQTFKANEAERKGWVDACSDRRYREDDEKAIRAGR